MLSPRPMYINPVTEVLQPLRQRYAAALEKRGQTLNVVVGTRDMLVWADPNLLLEACDNLLSNAIQYGTEAGTIVVTITERGLVDEISVWNSGRGIRPQALETIFEAREKSSTGAISEENSISLKRTRQIIEAHGGRLWAESEPGAWVNFILTLPRRHC